MNANSIWWLLWMYDVSTSTSLISRPQSPIPLLLFGIAIWIAIDKFVISDGFFAGLQKRDSSDVAARKDKTFFLYVLAISTLLFVGVVLIARAF